MEINQTPPREENNIGHELTSNDINWFTFRNKDDQMNYRRFRVKEVSRGALLVLLVLSTIMQIFFAVVSTTSDNATVIVVLRLFRVSAVIPGWLLLYYLWVHRNESLNTPTYLANFYTILVSVSVSLSLLTRVLSGRCDEDASQHEKYNCNPEADVNMLPQDSTFTVLIMLVVLEIVVKCVDWWAIFVSWIVAASMLITSMAIVGVQEGGLAMPCIMIVILCLLYEVECSYLRFYVVMHNNQMNMRTTMRTDLQRQVIEQQAVEMRHLLGNVAHDMKTPVQSFVIDLEHLEKKIRGCIKHTCPDEQCSGEILDTIQNLNDTNVFMRMIINRAIDYSKCSFGAPLLPSLHVVEWYEHVKNIIKLVQAKSRVPIFLSPLPDNVCSHIVTDKQWLIENTLCLVSNAVKFTMEGEVTVQCSVVDSEESERKLLIEVEDTGIGIPEEKRDSMFRPFQQTTRIAGGTGLGLYSMALRMRALGGECGLRDRSDGRNGVCVWFKIPYTFDVAGSCSTSTASSDENVCAIDHPTLPHVPLVTAATGHEMLDPKQVLKRKAIEALTTETPRGVVDRTTSRSSDEVRVDMHSDDRLNSSRLITVLLVDDSPIIRKSVSRALSNNGCTVELAENGEIGLGMMKAKQYDLVLMDIQMPVMDGLDATKALRQHEIKMNIASHDIQRIVGISAYHGDEMGACCIDCGMQGFIEKPFTQKQLIQCCYELGIDCFQKHV